MSVGDISFGKFLLTADRQLRFPSGRSVQLSRRASSVLAALVRESERGVTKEQLLTSAWPRTLATDESLTRVISDLRKIFAAEGHQPVETIYGFGYRFRLPRTDETGEIKRRRAESLRREAWHRVAARRIETLHSAEHLFSLAHAEHEAAEDWLGVAEVQIHRMQLGYARAQAAWPIAVDALERALAREPASALAYLGFGLSCIERDFDRAEQALADARRADPLSSTVRYCSGWRALSQGDLAAAIRYFEETTRIDPGNFNALGLAALALAFDGQKHRALESIRRLSELDAEGPVAAGYSAWVESTVGDPTRAHEAAERCVAQLPQSPTALCFLAQSLAASGRTADTLAVLNSATADGTTVGCHTLSSPAWLVLGRVQHGRDALKRGRQERCPWAAIVRHDPRVSHLGLATSTPAARSDAPQSVLARSAR